MVGKCREWTEEQVETAAVLCLVYGKFIEVRSSCVTKPFLISNNFVGMAAEGSCITEQSIDPAFIGKFCA